MANQLTMADIEQIKLLAETTDWSARRIARVLKRDRGTVSKYIAQFRSEQTAAIEQPPDTPQPDSKPAKVITGNQPKSRSVCEPYRDKIEPLVEQGLTADRVHRELVSEHEFTHSYQSVSRFVRSLKNEDPERIWRMECEPGEEAQVDFGVIKTLRAADGKKRFSNVLRVTLSFSRKGYTETLPYQNTECLIRSLENAFRHFGGTPKTVRIDNLKAGVKKADWYDPELNPKIADFANHYGTAIIPTRPYTPQHKGKVERDVAYVKSSALKGKEFDSIQEQNTCLKDWEANVADLRIHGTTRKQVQQQFLDLEKPTLQPLPDSLFPCYSEGPRKVHRDSYIDVEKAYYDVPLEFTKTQVWVRWDSKMVYVFDGKMEKIISHVRLSPGQRTKVLGARGSRKGEPPATANYWLTQAATFGQNAEKWAIAMATNRPDYAIRVLQGLLSLNKQDRHLVVNIDRACEVALASGEYHLSNIKSHLKQIELTPESVHQQAQFAFIDDHPLIRPLSDYAKIINDDL